MAVGTNRIVSASHIIGLLQRFNNCFPRTIESRVGNLKSYAVKLSEHAWVYSAKDNGELAGFLVLYANDTPGKMAYLTHIAVLEQHQNKGIGSLLLQLSFDVSKEQGMKQIKLEVDTTNNKAMTYYTKHNFITVDQASFESQYMVRELT